MLYIVVETFKNAPQIYDRLREKGSMMPEGLNYVSSWIDQDFKQCFQLMETEDFKLFEIWIANWDDLMGFEIIPVMTSQEASEQIRK